MKKVVVMLSSYNGEKYISQQIDSILLQNNVDLSLYIRDDGSSDNTIDILKEYEQEHQNIKVFYGDNVGYIKSFMWLVQNVDTSEDMWYAFSDQDDFWKPDKLFSAITLLEKEKNQNIPLLYYSDLNVVDENLRFIRKANVWEGTFDKYKSLMFIAARGCTMVYNNALNRVINSYNPENISGHDPFIALLAFWSGKVIYDSNAYIDYRQTGSNVSITGTSKVDALKKNIQYVKRRFTDKANERERNARVLLEGYKPFLSEIDEIEKIANYKKSLNNKIKLLKDRRLFNFHFSINVVNVLFVLFGKL